MVGAMPATTPAPDTAPAAADPDFLDRGIANALWGLDAAIAWTINKLVQSGAAILAFSERHWMLVAAILIGCVLYRKFMRWRTVGFVIAEYAIRKRIAEAMDSIETKKAEAKRARERAWLARASRRTFDARIAALKASIKRHEELHDLLFQLGMADSIRGDELHEGATKHKNEAEQLKLEIIRLESLWACQRVFRLVDRLVNGSDNDAKIALSELNKIWRQVDWDVFVPKIASNADRQRLIQLFGVMASNAQLGEARNAFAFAQKILNNYKRTWGRAA
jgi:hypothetical protein